MAFDHAISLKRPQPHHDTSISRGVLMLFAVALIIPLLVVGSVTVNSVAAASELPTTSSHR